MSRNDARVKILVSKIRNRRTSWKTMQQNLSKTKGTEKRRSESIADFLKRNP